MTDCGKILFFEPTAPVSLPNIAAPCGDRGIDREASDTLASLVRIIALQGQDPATQLAGYLVTEDPTDLPDSDHARALADRVGRDKLMETLIRAYVQTETTRADSAENCP